MATNSTARLGGSLVSDPQASALWEKLKRLSFDRGNGPRTFAARLASEQEWSVGFTARAIEEYRRFLLLFALGEKNTGGAVPSGDSQPKVRIVPSETVDKVWHLHLLYTHSYWEDLCRDILGGPLHHLPAEGTGGEAAELEQTYRGTLAAYYQIFGQSAPADVWPRPIISRSLASLGLAASASNRRFTAAQMLPGFLGMIALCAWIGAPLHWVIGVGFVSLAIWRICVLSARASASRTRFGMARWSGESGGNVSGFTCSGDSSGGGHSGHDAGGHSHSCGGHSCGGHGCGGGSSCGGGGH